MSDMYDVYTCIVVCKYMSSMYMRSIYSAQAKHDTTNCTFYIIPYDDEK